MIEFLKALPWGVIAKYAAGAVALGGGVVYLKNRAAVNAASTQTDDTGSAGGGGFSPMFMSAGGQLNPAPLPSLGGETWSPGEPTSGQSDEVTIAMMQRDIAMAQIAAQQSIADKGFSNLFPTTSEMGNTGNGGSVLLPPLSLQDLYDSPYAGVITPKAKPKATYREGVDFTKQALSQGDAGLRKLYSEATARGYSTGEVASLLNAASGKANTSANINAAKSDIQNWITKNNLVGLG